MVLRYGYRTVTNLGVQVAKVSYVLSFTVMFVIIIIMIWQQYYLHGASLCSASEHHLYNSKKRAL